MVRKKIGQSKTIICITLLTDHKTFPKRVKYTDTTQKKKKGSHLDSLKVSLKSKNSVIKKISQSQGKH